jgi:uncharacterized protein (TIRG00374 family)
MRRSAFAAAKLIVGIAASVGLGWLATRGLDWGLVRENLGGASTPLLALTFAVFMSAAWLRALRWRILFANVNISTMRLFVVQHEGLGLSNLMPIRVTSEMTQLAVLTLRDGVRGATALATLGMERVIDVVASTMLLGVAFFLVPEMKNFTVFVWGAITFTVFAVGMVRLFAWSGSLKFVNRFRFLADFVQAVKELEQERLRLVMSFSVSVCYWLLVGVTAWLVSAAVDLPLSPMVATVVILGTIFFATAVPAAPSALGTFEFAVVYVLGFFDVERTDAFGFAVICHVVFFMPATVMAIVFLPREGVGAFGWARSLARVAGKRAGR